MNRFISYLSLGAFAVVSFILVAARPDWVSDNNAFLEQFVNHEFLNLLGVILAITLASVANIHLEFNKIEEALQSEGLHQSRRNLKKNARFLIALFMIGFAIVFAKPLAGTGETAQGFFNMAAMTVVLWHILILISLTNLVFAIPPNIRKK